MAKITKREKKILIWVGIIILILIILNSTGIIDVSNLFSVTPESIKSQSSIGVGDIKHYVT